MKIGPRTLRVAKQGISELLDTYQGKMNLAFDQQEDSLTVNLKLKFTPAKSDTMRVEYSIAFTESQIKDGNALIVDEMQMPLPLED